MHNDADDLISLHTRFAGNEIEVECVGSTLRKNQTASNSADKRKALKQLKLFLAISKTIESHAAADAACFAVVLFRNRRCKQSSAEDLID